MSEHSRHTAVFTNTHTNDASHWARIIFADIQDKLSSQGEEFSIDSFEPTNTRGYATPVSDVITKTINDSGLDNTLIKSLCRSVSAYGYIFEGAQIHFEKSTTEEQKRVDFAFE